MTDTPSTVVKLDAVQTSAVAEEFTLQSDPEHTVTIQPASDVDTYTWKCSSCYDCNVQLELPFARLQAFHHSMVCGLRWDQVEEGYRDTLAEAAGARRLVRLHIYGGDTDDYVTIEDPGGLANVNWRCDSCDTTFTDWREFYAYAGAAVHAAECQRDRNRQAPETYLDELERALEPRIEQRQTEAAAPIQAQLDQRDAELAELQTRHQELTDQHAAQAAEADRRGCDLAVERARTRIWRIAAAILAATAITGPALVALILR